MIRYVKRACKSLLDLYPKWLCRRDFVSQEFRRFNERPIEFAFVFRKLGEIYPKTVLDVGVGTTALPHLMRNCGFLVTATDNIRDYWSSGMVNRHYHVIDDDITNTKIRQEFDMVTCVSVLEHIRKFDDAVANMFSLLRRGGHLIITCPYSEKEYVQNVYQLPSSSYGQDATYITQSFSRENVERWLKASSGVLVAQEYWRFWEGDHWTIGNQVIPPKSVSVSDKHQLTCILLRKS